MSAILDSINRKPAKTMEKGQRYVIKTIVLVERDDTFNPGHTKQQAIITTPDGDAYYAPANLTRACIENPGELEDLTGIVIECGTYYSQRLRREVKTAIAVSD